MKQLFILTLFSVAFTQELKVEGDLNVSGNILNSKIDSLEWMVNQLQAQISILLNYQPFKVFDIDNEYRQNDSYSGWQVIYDTIITPNFFEDFIKVSRFDFIVL